MPGMNNFETKLNIMPNYYCSMQRDYVTSHRGFLGKFFYQDHNKKLLSLHLHTIVADSYALLCIFDELTDHCSQTGKLILETFETKFPIKSYAPFSFI